MSKAGYSNLSPLPPDLSEEDKNAYVAAGKAIGYLSRKEAAWGASLETGSVYGAAVAIPQLARSSGWSGSMIALTVQSYLFLLINLCLQLFLMAMITEEVSTMSRYSGQMHLCDIGAGAGLEADCGGRSNCMGPGGSNVTMPREYSFDIWMLRNFLKSSLEAIATHEQRDAIDANVDPGEYGIQNYWCRIASIFLFMLAMVDDFNKSTGLAAVLCRIPTASQRWIYYEVPPWGSKASIKKVHGWTELDLVKFTVAGMPLFWKIVNVVFVVLPKLFVWYSVASLGFQFLMETAGIVDALLNSMAMSFVLSLDEMVFECFSTGTAKHMMSNLAMEESSNGEQEDEGMSDEDVLQAFHDEEIYGRAPCRLLCMLIPRRLLRVLGLAGCFLVKYYVLNCTIAANGSLVSVPMYAPTGLKPSPLEMLLGVTGQDGKPYWSMSD